MRRWLGVEEPTRAQGAGFCTPVNAAVGRTPLPRRVRLAAGPNGLRSLVVLAMQATQRRPLPPGPLHGHSHWGFHAMCIAIHGPWGCSHGQVAAAALCLRRRPSRRGVSQI